MALKAIGDFGTGESRAFLDEQREILEGQPNNLESGWTLQIIRLYL